MSAQVKELIVILEEEKSPFAWEYQDMQGINLDTSTHNIYIKEGSHPIWQPQRTLNLVLWYVVKEEQWKILNVSFLYVILDSRYEHLLLFLYQRKIVTSVFV